MTAGEGTIAVVLARAGSRGLPGKNRLSLLGRPMVSYTLDAADEAACIDRTVVSTDDPEVARAASAAGVETVPRPAALATDDAPVDAAARHAVDGITAGAGTRPGIVVILYANVPVRPPGLIDRAVARLRETGADSVQSYAPVGKCHPDWMVDLGSGGQVVPRCPGHPHRRQDLRPLWLPDGGVIAVTRASLFTNGLSVDPHAFLGRDRRGIETEPGAVIDVDGPFDLLLAETILARRREDACP